MRILIISLVLLLGITTIGIAQERGENRPNGQQKGRMLSGTVKDETGTSIPYASVVVQSLRDSTRVKGSTTDDDGKFTMRTGPGKLKLTISFLSYEPYLSIVDMRDGDKDIGTIELKPKSELIDEVTVKAERGQMELKLDKRVFNVSKDPNNAGANTQEILETVPSVDVDIDGNVSLRGSSNVRILIDGKPSGLTGISTADALRQLQGDLIDKIEVISNASARYDAEGEAGIINIVLKKEKRSGFNGGFSINAGYPHNHGLSANLNYRKGKVNFFTSIGASYRTSPGQGSSFQKFTRADTTFSYQKDRTQTRGGLGGNGRFGIDYNIDSKTSLTVSGMYSRSWNTNNAELEYTDFNDSDEITQVVSRNEDEVENRQNIEADLNFTRTFKSKEHKLTFDARWFNSEDYEDATQLEIGNGYQLDQRSTNKENERNWLFQTDYVHPFGEKYQLEAGAKTTLRKLDNDYLVEQLNELDVWEPLPDYDNNFVFEENIYAAYLIGAAKWNLFSVQAGIRSEFSDITTSLVRTNQRTNRQYISFFPSVHTSLEVGKGNSIQLSYSRRISRPGFRSLIPFFGLTDNRNFYGGNPDLQPVFTNSMEFGHLKTWDNGSLLSTVYFRIRTDVQERISEADSTGFIRTFPINLSDEIATGYENSFSYGIYKWWRVTLGIDLYYFKREGEYEGQNFYAENFSASGRFTTKFTIAKKVDLQSSFRIRAPRKTAQGTRLTMYWWDIGVSMDVLKGNGTIGVKVRDLLNSRKRRWELETPEITSTNDFQWRSRQFMVSFSYRINQKKRRGGRGGGGGSGDESDL
ncbi:MAG: outer membrane receptor protein involved in Fe transport [Bacteroidia bacterium]|jgi:outer membrane receptor protein involved in Fe transport